MTSAADNETSSALRGFDSPVVSRQDDHLNRWPLAREIVGIATTGPKAWSVRVGIYGEWGTGKTSVLRFVDSMASQADHIVIWFDPWEHSTGHDLWQAFVLTVFEHLERKLGRVSGADEAKRKAWMDKAGRVVRAISSIANDKAGKAVEAGLTLVKKHFDFSPEDLASLQSILGDRRVIIFIDDLDRTTPELVPEILFALKELMEVPGFSFVCAFDPIVIGKVLGRHHPGFGEGLEFLEKIIDYPRWLPPASSDHLADLAVADAALSCDYVPQAAIRDAVSLLPRNPRVVRQFIRLLTLLKPHLGRHYDHELHWPVILSASIIKIRYPRLAHELLKAPRFWSNIGVLSMASPGQDKEKNLDAAVSEHIHSTCVELGQTRGSLDESEQRALKGLLKAICSHVAIFAGLEEQGVAYQVNVAEAPAAVTCKEFDSFLADWKSNQVAHTAKAWIAAHAERVERPKLGVYGEILNAAIRRYAEVLHQADNVFADAERPALVSQAGDLLSLLNTLILELGDLTQPIKQIADGELTLLVEEWAHLAGRSHSIRADFWPRNEELILALFERWSPDVMPLIRVLKPYAVMHLRNFDHRDAFVLHKKLSAVALPKFAGQIVASFRERGFVERLIHNQEDTFDARCMIWDARGPLWRQLRPDMFRVLNEAPSCRTIQGNAYWLLHWFVLAREGRGPGDSKAMQTLFSDQAVFDAVWNAAIATPLAPGAVYDLRDLVKMVSSLGIKCDPPPWWQQTMAVFIAPVPPGPPANGSDPTAPEEGS